MINDFLCSYAMTIAISSAAIYSIIEPIADATSLTVGDLNAGTGYMVNRPTLTAIDVRSPQI